MKSCATNQSRSASVGQMAKAAGNVSTIRPRVLINAQIAADLRAYFAVVFRQRIFTAARTSRLQMPIANTYSKCPKINLAEIVDRTRLTRASAQRWRSRCLMRSKEAFAYSRSTRCFCSVAADHSMLARRVTPSRAGACHGTAGVQHHDKDGLLGWW